MPIDTSIRKVMVIGSGPIVIGQAAEFDYAGAQACRVLPAAGVNAVLDSTVRGFGANLSLDGFRKGKVPARVIERRFPEEIVSRATETLVNGQVSEILEKEGLNPISRIEFDSGDARQVERDQSFSFTFSF